VSFPWFPFAFARISNYPVDTECVELADAQMMHAINLSASTSSCRSGSPGPYAVADSLFKLQVTPQSIAETSKVIWSILSTHRCDSKESFKLARGEDEARVMWDDRRGALYASMKLVEGCGVLTFSPYSVLNLVREGWDSDEFSGSQRTGFEPPSAGV
jgi:hypothetical protein